jgi:demethylsterigmatocystin 6-O-methyltransferase
MVLPDTGVHWHATSMDITMMGALGSQERTKSEFERIVEQAGLRIERTVVYTWPVQNAVMVLVKKEDGAGVELKRGLSGEFEEKVRVGE